MSGIKPSLELLENETAALNQLTAARANLLAVLAEG